jgi:hypothetical protein
MYVLGGSCSVLERGGEKGRVEYKSGVVEG